MLTNFALPVAFCLQYHDLLSVAAHQYIGVMGANDDLPLLFEPSQNVHQDGADQPLIDIVFRLVD